MTKLRYEFPLEEGKVFILNETLIVDFGGATLRAHAPKWLDKVVGGAMLAVEFEVSGNREDAANAKS